MIIEISVAVIAAAFVFLVIYLIVLALSISKTLKNVDNLLIDVRTQINDFAPEAKQKMESFNPLFNAISNVGEVLENKSTILKCKAASQDLQNKARNSFYKSIDQTSDDLNTRDITSSYVEDILEITALGIGLWQKLKNRR